MSHACPQAAALALASPSPTGSGDRTTQLSPSSSSSSSAAQPTITTVVKTGYPPPSNGIPRKAQHFHTCPSTNARANKRKQQTKRNTKRTDSECVEVLSVLAVEEQEPLLVLEPTYIRDVSPAKPTQLHRSENNAVFADAARKTMVVLHLDVSPDMARACAGWDSRRRSEGLRPGG
eukprot:37233-Rhodomonas_salina.4